MAIDVALRDARPDRGAAGGHRSSHQAKARLVEVGPTIVGITGSYGKTTTKVYAAQLIKGTKTVVATPASFNNKGGLSRAVNEHLAPGTEVFIAEMGTYGPGEIAELCSWCPPSVSAITAIGPVHLERFGTEDAIVEAKSEILRTATTTVLNVDDARLAARADERTIRCSGVAATTGAPTSATNGTDVIARIEDGRLIVNRGDEQLADVPAPDVVPSNVAVAVGIALAVGVPPAAISAGLAGLPTVSNRRAETTLSTGATAIDDTFNSNPEGCKAALATLHRLGSAGPQASGRDPRHGR